MADTVVTGISAEPAGSMTARSVRLAVFIAIALFMLAGPVVEQVLGTRSTFWRSWTMFSGIGLGLVDASFQTRQSDGTLLPLDRFATLDAQRDRKVRRIVGADELTKLIQRLCQALGPEADLRVKARVAMRQGWQIIRTEDRNACAG